MKLEGAIKLNFAGVKNFKLNGKAMKSEVEAERARLQRLGVNVPDPVDPDPVDPDPVDPDPVDPDPVDPDPVDPDPVDPDLEDTYDINAVYVKGDVVIYNGQTYVCKWWTKGEIPGSSEWGPWQLQ